MAQAPLKICPGCRRAYTRAKRCEACTITKPVRQASTRDTRPSAAARGYDHRWQKVRDVKIAQDPLCEDCLERGDTTAAEEVHHTLKVADHPEHRLDIDTLRSLCGTCHKRRTRRGE